MMAIIYYLLLLTLLIKQCYVAGHIDRWGRQSP